MNFCSKVFWMSIEAAFTRTRTRLQPQLERWNVTGNVRLFCTCVYFLQQFGEAAAHAAGTPAGRIYSDVAAIFRAGLVSEARALGLGPEVLDELKLANGRPLTDLLAGPDEDPPAS
jgi:hypothetical protein